jgi:hypothetical protein
VQELLEVEPGSKWPLLTLARLLEMRRQVEAEQPRGRQAEPGGGGGGEVPEMRELYEELCQVDPMRSGYYREAADTWARTLARKSA